MYETIFLNYFPKEIIAMDFISVKNYLQKSPIQADEGLLVNRFEALSDIGLYRFTL
jgi:hypothetical protein